MCVCATSTSGLIEVHWGVSVLQYDCLVGGFLFFISLPTLLKPPKCRPALIIWSEESPTPLLWVQIRSTVRAKRKKRKLILLSLATAAQVVSSHRFDSRSDLSSAFLSVRWGRAVLMLKPRLEIRLFHLLRNPKCAGPTTVIHLYGRFSRRLCALACKRLICLAALVWKAARAHTHTMGADWSSVSIQIKLWSVLLLLQ